MNRGVLILLTLCFASAGAAAGWFTAPDREKATTRTGRSAATAAENQTPASAAAPVEFPDLASAADCREFLRLAETRYKGRHPLVIQSLRDYAIRRWLELDAESALAEAEKNPGGDIFKQSFAKDLFRVWLDLDVTSAITAWRQASPALTRVLRYTFMQDLAKKDGAKAIAECRASRDKADGSWDGVEMEAFRVWAKYDPAAAAGMAWPSKGSGQEVEAVVAEWVQTDPSAASAWMRANNIRRNRGAVLPALLKTDPAAAKELCKDQKDGGLSNYEQYSALRNWTEADPMDALRWAESQPQDGPLVPQTLEAAARKLATSDPDHALKHPAGPASDAQPAGGPIEFVATAGTQRCMARGLRLAGSHRFRPRPRAGAQSAR